MIQVEGLRRAFASPEGGMLQAVDGVSLAAQPGEVVGLLGPNGAGKTTTLRILATLMAADSGTATLNGFDIRTHPSDVRRSIGYLSTTTGLYGRLTPREVLAYIGELQGVGDPTRRADELIARFDITRYAHIPCDKLSTGMKQKVSIARAVVHDPPILIFDEPTTGLDVLVAHELLTFLEEARSRGRCILYSTHIMGEAERLCDRLVVIHRGRVLATGTAPELRARTGKHYLEDVFIALVQA